MLADPSLMLAYRAGDGYIDISGRALIPPAAGDLRRVAEVAHDSALLLGDPALGGAARSSLRPSLMWPC
jgi:hypothetical protein